MRSLIACLFLASLTAWGANGPGHEPDPTRAKLAIIIDDVGYNRALGERTARLAGAYTLALLPHTPHSHYLAELTHRQGKEQILHAPMENMAGLALGPGALTLQMSRAEFTASLRKSIAHFPHIVGLNNHMGSALTREPQPMGWTMSEARRAKLYFVDSRTTAQSVAHQTAQAYGLASAKRDVFLDHEIDREHIHRQLLLAVQRAKTQGHAIAIGHPYKETLQVLEQVSEQWYAEQGVELVSASALVAPSPPGAGFCQAPPPLLRQWTMPPAQLQSQAKSQMPSKLIEFGYQQLL
ncbi:divergent polysaccharide deacetylase family protein [Gilvimarinus agarilyticus]|uniref:divergent polysaccharide deacetylase family protein n=1 Tax=Gilvimarinus sp. 2_MG-2023 TaxID=3062666 RepID=UPI001C0941D8|nr:divergent polysaccharide deacetylase family protein [Gilvimarinus sp. 2_MG-2023]MBU2885799.1 divergent polysaccharide deacetylase family protein [Gilvimarinus agarilyticus]MDO6570653.1 divergent polysaccharide deacetylase family protein [Gilvimarinus sp. 2_MG-2023]